jgi:hypothetical protein
MFLAFMAGIAKGEIGIPWLNLAGDFEGLLFKCRWKEIIMYLFTDNDDILFEGSVNLKT